MSFVGMVLGKKEFGFGHNSTAEEVSEGLDLTGRTYVVTGANSGLGLETVRVLALRGGRVIALARTLEKAESAIADLQGKHEAVACDLSEPASVDLAIQTIQDLGHEIDCILANAGIMALPECDQKHGLELQFLTNHVGHFVLVTGLLETLAANARVVVLSSSAHQRPYSEGIQFSNLDGKAAYSPWKAYGQSKLANLLFSNHLSSRLKEGQSCNAVHPGVIGTNLMRNLPWIARKGMGWLRPIYFKTIPQGAATQVFVATHSAVDGITGEYFSDSGLTKPSRKGRDVEMAEKLWAVTEEWVAQFRTHDGKGGAA